eukprot:COSAG02_NODE_15754_length_1143_cov_41.100575_1_plen_83_part_00
MVASALIANRCVLTVFLAIRIGLALFVIFVRLQPFVFQVQPYSGLGEPFQKVVFRDCGMVMRNGGFHTTHHDESSATTDFEL